MTRLFMAILAALGLTVGCASEDPTPTPKPYDHTADIWVMQTRLDQVAYDVNVLTQIANGTGERVVYEEPIGDTLLVAWVNHASGAGLETLPGIGPALAAAIIERRPIRRLDELLEVQGVGPVTLARMRALVVQYVRD